MNIRSRHFHRLRVVVVVTKLRFSFRTMVKLSRQAMEFIERNRRQLRGLLLPVSQILDVDSLTDRSLSHEIVHLIFIVNLLAVETHDEDQMNDLITKTPIGKT